METLKIAYLELLMVLFGLLSSISVLLSFFVDSGREKTRRTFYPHEVPEQILNCRGFTTPALISK